MPDEAVISRDTEALRGYLAERDVPCPKCNFNLRGGTKPTCPECGEPIRLMVARPEALWTMRRLLVAVVLAHSLSYAVFSLQAAGSYLTQYQSLLAAFGPTEMLLSVMSVAVSLGVAIGLAIALLIYALRRRQPDGRAVSGLFVGFLLAMAINGGWQLTYIAFTFVRGVANFFTL